MTDDEVAAIEAWRQIAERTIRPGRPLLGVRGGGVGHGSGFAEREAARATATDLPDPGEYEAQAREVLEALGALDVDVEAGLALEYVDEAAVRIVAAALRAAGRR